MISLPTETLRDIFLLSLWDGNPRERNCTQFGLDLQPLVLSHVCGYWRGVSLSFGELWSYLSIDYGQRVTPNPEHLMKLFDLWLQRTNGLALNYAFQCFLFNPQSYDYTPELYRASEYIIRALLSEQYRWKDVDFRWIISEPPFDFLEIKATNMPMLRSLVLQVDIGERARRVLPHIDVSGSLRLQSLNLWDIHDFECSTRPIKSSRVACSLEYIKDTAGEFADAIQCCKFLEIVPNLVQLEIRFVYLVAAPDTLPTIEGLPNLVLHHLRVLSLAAGLPSAFIIRRLCAPSLEALKYWDRCYPDGDETFFDFIRRTIPPLTHLHTKEQKEDILISVLRLLPSLVALTIGRTVLSAQILEALTMSTSHRDDSLSTTFVICPALRFLSFSEIFSPSPGDHISETALMDAFETMLNSRLEISNSFTRVVCKRTGEVFNLPLDSLDRDPLQTSLIDGFQITIMGDNPSPDPFPRRLSFKGSVSTKYYYKIII